MPYYGAKTEKEDYEATVKVNGPETEKDINKFRELAEFLNSIAPNRFADTPELAKYLAEKAAKALREDPNALWVSVDVCERGGFCSGFIVMLER